MENDISLQGAFSDLIHIDVTGPRRSDPSLMLVAAPFWMDGTKARKRQKPKEIAGKMRQYGLSLATDGNLIRPEWQSQ